MALAALFITGAAHAAPPTWKVDPAKSSVTFTAKHNGLGDLRADFQKWTAAIAFDPADLAHSKVTVTLPTGTLKTGQKMVDPELGKAEWFDAKAHPTATYTATSFTALGGGKYNAAGTLSLKGKTYPINLPFTLAINGNVAIMTATQNLDRTRLDIGMTSDPDAEWVQKIVKLDIAIRATK
jgi:polyisoprenoid-binding protein YceI